MYCKKNCVFYTYNYRHWAQAICTTGVFIRIYAMQMLDILRDGCVSQEVLDKFVEEKACDALYTRLTKFSRVGVCCYRRVINRQPTEGTGAAVHGGNCHDQGSLSLTS